MRVLAETVCLWIQRWAGSAFLSTTAASTSGSSDGLVRATTIRPSLLMESRRQHSQIWTLAHYLRTNDQRGDGYVSKRMLMWHARRARARRHRPISGESAACGWESTSLGPSAGYTSMETIMYLVCLRLLQQVASWSQHQLPETP